MRLYQAPASPYARKVMVLLHETGQTSDVELVLASGNAVDTGTMPLERNPLGKIPALERDDGPTLYDSRVICRYLDAQADSGLYPLAPVLWDTLTVEATADGMCDAALLMIYEGRVRPEEIRFSPWIEGQWAKIARGLDALETRWLAHLHGPLDMSQIAVGCMLGYLDFRLGARNWRDGHPGLAAWEAGFAKRPSMQATVPVG